MKERLGRKEEKKKMLVRWRRRREGDMTVQKMIVREMKKDYEYDNDDYDRYHKDSDMTMMMLTIKRKDDSDDTERKK